MLGLLLLTLGAGAQAPDMPAPQAPPTPGSWRAAPDYLWLFIPRIYRDSYRTFTSDLPLDAAARLVASAEDDAGDAPPTGAWIPHSEHPVDAFGSGGTYDRWKLARLYGSQQPSVARGPRTRHGIVEESWTLVSPYPSADLTRLEPGTLLIVLRIP